MDWSAFVQLVSVTRLEVLAIALALTVVLGVASALKAGDFKWASFAKFLQPNLNFFYMILGYLVSAVVSTILPDTVDSVVVIATYTAVVIAMAVKIKEQLAYLGVPLTGWKLPLEAKT